MQTQCLSYAQPPLWRLSARLLALCSLTLIGCASAPQDRGATAISNNISTLYRLEMPQGSAARWYSALDASALDQSLSAKLTPETAVQIALRNNPKMRLLYAELGIAQAELMDATRIANPSFDWARLKPTEGDIPAKLTFGLSQSVIDLLMLGARRNLATGALQRTSKEIQAQVSALIFEVESAYWHAVGAEAVRSMRALVAESAASSSDLAERFFAAGNISRGQLVQENAASAEALVSLKNAEASAFAASAHLNQLLGLAAVDARVQLDASLPEMAKAEDSLSALQSLAQTQRADLAAKRQNVTLLSALLTSARRWRWFGSLDLSAERERESDGEKLRGIGFSLGLPIFNQGQGSILHAQSMLEIATVQRDQAELAVQSEIEIGLLKLIKHREIVQTYKDVLVPAREVAVAEMHKRYNFMLIGAFELLQAKQAEYDAYQGYLDALRDYWLARTELKFAVGGELPSKLQLDPNAKVGPPGPAKNGAPMRHGEMQMNATTEHDHSAMQAPPIQATPTQDPPTGASAIYVCPMHPDVISDKPGKCPICGMELEPNTGSKAVHQHHDESGEAP